MNNLHKLYYKDYFKGVSFDYLLNDSEGKSNADITVRNKALTASSYSFKKGQEWKLKDELLIKNEAFPNNDKNKFSLEVQYPGLVTGIGISHETKIEGEFKLGMHFDWTYGMPIIYGSSVKGVLRSYFKEFYTPKQGEPSTAEAIDDIFEGRSKSIYDRDIFFDAVIIEPDNKGRILCSDSITPHGDNPLKNPTPLTFLKIAPGCKLQFRFKLVPTVIKKADSELKLTVQRKLEIFKDILTTVGIGAKTNVGYGQLKEA